MKPLLASLVLLLLALCRQSSSTVTIESSDTKSTEAVTTIQKAEDNKFTKELVASGQEKAVKAATKDIQNIFVVLLHLFVKRLTGSPTPLSASNKKTMENGVLCTLKDPKYSADSLKTLFNGANPGDKEKEKNLGLLIGIDCSATTKDACFCTENKFILYCAMEKYKTEFITATVPGICKEEALKELKEAGTKTLGHAYDYEELEKKEKDPAMSAVFLRSPNAIDLITKHAEKTMTNFFCDAIDLTVEAKVKQLFESDVAFGLVEYALFKVLFHGKEKAVEDACKTNVELKKDVFGQCLCDGDVGLTFCIYKAMGKYFHKEGFLDCQNNQFVPAKKPATVPELVPAALLAGSSTSSLMMVPLMAAAVLLARH